MPTPPAADWPPALELALRCARPTLRPWDQARAQAAATAIADWNHALALVAAHGILPLLHHHVARGTVQIPAEAAERLTRQAQASAQRVLALSAELCDVVAACETAGIAVLPLKGPVLAQFVYGSAALRSPMDLDLLFRPSDLDAVAGLLRRRGYRFAGDLPHGLDRLARVNSHHEPPAVHPGKRITIERHNCLATHRGRRLTLDAVAERTQPIPFMGRVMPILNAEEQFVYLCQHGGGHAWSKVEWLSAVAELARSHVHDWPRVWASAALWGGPRPVQAAIALARRLFDEVELGVTMPEDGWTRRANEAVVRRLRGRPEQVLASSSQRFAYRVYTDPSYAARVRRCLATMLVPTAEDFTIALPRVLWPLYYVVRPVRMIYRGVSAVVLWLRSDDTEAVAGWRG